MDRGITGNFEVFILGRGKGEEDTLIHSKRHGGQGKGNTTKERERIVEQIREVLEEV